MGRDLVLGCLVGAATCATEYWANRLQSSAPQAYRLDTLVLIPVLVLLAGWRAGVYEELLFRSLTQGYLIVLLRRPWIAVLIQAALFFLAHPRYYPHGQYSHALNVGATGLVCGILTLRAGSILPAMIVHSLMNSYGAAALSPKQAINRALKSWMR